MTITIKEISSKTVNTKAHRKKNKLRNKVVIITGASSGIGKALAFEFAKRGAKVVLASRNIFLLSVIQNKIQERGGNALIVKTDVTKKEDCNNLIKQTVSHFGTIDILISNAGISMHASFSDLDLSVIEKLMDTNFYGAIYCTKYAMPYLLKKKGSVIGISSLSGITPLPGRTGYCASKYALDGFLNTIRIEYLKKNLHVMTVHPWFTASNIRNSALNKDGVTQKETPRNEEKMMSSEKLAKIIVKATVKRKNNLVISFKGKLLVWLYRNFSSFTDKLIYNGMVKEQGSEF